MGSRMRRGCSRPRVPVTPNESILGDFGGARTASADRGFTLNGHVTSELAGKTMGGIPIGETSEEPLFSGSERLSFCEGSIAK